MRTVVTFPQKGQPWKIWCVMICCKGVWPFYSVCRVSLQNFGGGMRPLLKTCWPVARNMWEWSNHRWASNKGHRAKDAYCPAPPNCPVNWRQHCSGNTDRPTNARLKPQRTVILSPGMILCPRWANHPKSVSQHHSGSPVLWGWVACLGLNDM